MANFTNQTSSNQQTNASQNYTFPLIIIAILFFIFGFVTSLNDILIPHLKTACQLTDFQSAFVQFAFFGSYFLMSIPAGAVLKRTGYKNGIVLGLAICACGAALFIPAANTRYYPLFLLGLSVLASGVTLLQVAANPYVTVLGSATTASSRLSIMGTLNSLGAALGPYVGARLIFSNSWATLPADAILNHVQADQLLDEQAASVKLPYFILMGLLLVFACLVYICRLPEIDGNTSDEEKTSNGKSIMQYPHLILGVIAIFLYVGAEVSIGSFMILYGESLSIPGFTIETGAMFASYYGMGAMGARLLGIVILPKVNPAKALAFNSFLAIVFVTVSTLLLNGELALWVIALTGMCHSIMWPVIFPLALKDLGGLTKRGSSLLIMAVVGGAIVPLVIGFFSDKIGINYALLITALCYVYIFYYGVRGHKTTV